MPSSKSQTRLHSLSDVSERESDVSLRGGAGGRLYGGEADLTEPFLPDERVDLATAVAAFTMGSAYVNHLDDVTGSIEVGKHADVIVLDRDIFAQPVDEISQASVELTFVGGMCLHDASG